MEHSNVPGDGSRFSRDKSNAASDKLEMTNALSAVIQSLVALALQLNALANISGRAPSWTKNMSWMAVTVLFNTTVANI